MHPIAHTAQNKDGTQREPHDLESHLFDVAMLAHDFAEHFGNGDWAYLAGLWHDLGKYKPAFQNYIRKQSNYEAFETDACGTTDKQHAISGAIHAVEQFGEEGILFSRVFGYLIAGHHTGLPDWNHEIGVGGALQPKLQEIEHLGDALLGQPPASILQAVLPHSSFNCPDGKQGEFLHFWIRMLFSCLVDADFLDTERYMESEKSETRAGSTSSLHELKERFDLYMIEKTKGVEPTPVNMLRQEILSQCRDHASWEPGVFSLSVPTGGGKTLSGMAFALEHAILHRKRRIIIAIPYTSIIEQTADQYRKVFGNEIVLEHHSNLDPDRETLKSRLASENWDAPIIVTTNVQLFESLFAARTSACRKLHNITDSVIILDEAQMLPPEFIEPIVSSIKALTEVFGCSVVLSTATQPVLNGRIQSGKAILHGFEQGKVRELMSDRVELSRRLQRVTIVPFIDSNQSVSWEEIAEAIKKEQQVLCIVNTRRDCRELFDLMPNGTIHLSALMCAEHRSQVITAIKKKLSNQEPIRVISTQLVEAGVDLDFPVVYRAMAGFDSIAQAAGRCNREGNLNQFGKLGRTVVFQPPKSAPSGMLLKGQQAGAEILRLYPDLVSQLDPDIYPRYFQLFYSKVNSFDEKGIGALLSDSSALDVKIQFRSAAQKFSLIDDAGQVPVVVWYTRPACDGESELSGKELVQLLEKTGPYRTLMRRIQRFTVTVPKRVVDGMLNEGFLRLVDGQDRLYTQTELMTHGNQVNIYDEVFGLKVEGSHFTATDYNV